MERALQGEIGLDNMLQLVCHPETPSDDVLSVMASADLSSDGVLRLHYHVDGFRQALVWDPAIRPFRTDGLWQNTCFEAFLRRGDDEEYIELNFSPSKCWAAYRFDDYRDGMRDLDVGNAPAIECNNAADHIALTAQINVPTDWAGHDLSIALCAVVRETSNAVSYWALTHPENKPDFHDQACFTLQLQAAG
jgi:hypothetical protein